MTRSDRLNTIETLLAERAVRALAPDERRQLDGLLGEFPEVDEGELDRAAAALALAHVHEEPMPAALRDRLLAEADAWAEESTSAPVVGTEAVGAPWVGRLGWFVAAAAMVLAVVGWWPALREQPPPTPTPMAIVDQAEDRLRVPWQASANPAAEGADGELMWSSNRQTGYMRFLGLAPNDPDDSQYQLWIFDATREPHPVDGGVFNIPESAPEDGVVVPIRAKLPVGRPTLFAVTIEPPGGVVVSDQERIVLVAEPE